VDAGPRSAIVTGGSSGIGLAVGRLLAARGYDVVLSARREGPLAAAAGEVGARWVAGDAADPDDAARLVAAAGRVDLLVHAAGVMAGTFVRRESLDTFAAVLRANLTSAFVIAHAALPAMGAGGRMVFLSSTAAHAPQPGRAAYSASKAGLTAFAGALAREVERDGIAVHVVTTGPVATPMRSCGSTAGRATSCSPRSGSRRSSRARSPRSRSSRRPPAPSGGPTSPSRAGADPPVGVPHRAIAR
jgi:NAD(P)-dependent dehydrogenase (short-subunit alcohol dehydrogenase family)